METTTPQQELTINHEPQKEHQWLQQLVGEWTYESDAKMGPDHPSEKSTGTETVRTIGNLWVQCEGQGEMCGGPGTTIMTLGYDAQKQQFVGTWIGSMMAYLWLYEGELDDSGKVLTLSSRGPSMAGDGTIGQYKDVIELKSDDHRIMTSHAQSDNGQWYQFMTTLYSRSK